MGMGWVSPQWVKNDFGGRGWAGSRRAKRLSSPGMAREGSIVDVLSGRWRGGSSGGFRVGGEVVPGGASVGDGVTVPGAIPVVVDQRGRVGGCCRGSAARGAGIGRECGSGGWRGWECGSGWVRGARRGWVAGARSAAGRGSAGERCSGRGSAGVGWRGRLGCMRGGGRRRTPLAVRCRVRGAGRVRGLAPVGAGRGGGRLARWAGCWGDGVRCAGCGAVGECGARRGP